MISDKRDSRVFFRLFGVFTCEERGGGAEEFGEEGLRKVTGYKRWAEGAEGLEAWI